MDTTSPAPATALVQLLDVTKSFGATKAVRGVTMDLARRGEIHALVGENGAGKSTCLGMAAGRVAPTTGTVLVGGREMRGGQAREFKQAGIHAIYQELTVLPALPPTANVFLGQELSSGSLLRESAMRAKYEEACARLGLEPRFIARSGDLAVADQQLIEIMRALVADPAAILFDEPTTSLAHSERESLFRTMRQLRDGEMALAWVSHNLEEVLEHSDRVTVFRDGQVVEERPAAAWSKADLVVAMVGANHRAVDGAARSTPAPRTDGAPALKVRDLVTRSGQPISFDVAPGEILGVAGLVGSGRTTLMRALAGLGPATAGTVQIGDETQDRPPRTVREARRRGIAMLTEDRKSQGLLLRRSASENVMLGGWSSAARGPLLRDRTLDNVARGAATSAGFDPARIHATADQLSGGNQQKLLVARLIHGGHRVLLADEPTRGVDIGAKAEILAALEEVVASGRSVIVVSSEFDELVELCDRVLVLYDGHHVGTFDRATEPLSVKNILSRIFHDAAVH